MSRQILFRKGHLIVVRSFAREDSYYTIVNIITSYHSHVYENEYKAAIMICKCAYRKVVPNKYPEWMKESIRRLIHYE